jgi:hypothetical protein
MRSTLLNRRTVRLLASLTLLSAVWPASAEEKTSARLLVKDALTAPNQPATIEAQLTAKRLLGQTGLGGEPLELVIDGNVVATGMTGGDGRAFLSYVAETPGVVPVTVRVGNSPRVRSTEAGADLAVWERRNPIVAVEMAALIEEPPLQGPLPNVLLKPSAEQRPLPDAAEVLGKLSRFYYRIIYVVSMPEGSDPFPATVQAREWLKAHKFPSGYVLAVSVVAHAWEAQLDKLHAAGWKTLKTGIGRSKAFAEAFLQRRLEAILVPEPARGEVPRKAKVAKTWKEVRKKL